MINNQVDQYNEQDIVYNDEMPFFNVVGCTVEIVFVFIVHSCKPLLIESLAYLFLNRSALRATGFKKFGSLSL